MRRRFLGPAHEGSEDKQSHDREAKHRLISTRITIPLGKNEAQPGVRRPPPMGPVRWRNEIPFTGPPGGGPPINGRRRSDARPRA